MLLALQRGLLSQKEKGDGCEKWKIIASGGVSLCQRFACLYMCLSEKEGEIKKWEIPTDSDAPAKKPQKKRSQWLEHRVLCELFFNFIWLLHSSGDLTNYSIKLASDSPKQIYFKPKGEKNVECRPIGLGCVRNTCWSNIKINTILNNLNVSWSTRNIENITAGTWNQCLRQGVTDALENMR